MTKKILMIEHQPVVREGFRRLVEQSGEFALVAEAEAGRDGYAAYFRALPDLVVMELCLPDIDGLEISRRILQEDPRAKILAFNSDDCEMIVRRVKEVGIKGFVNKRASAQVILEGLNAVVKGESFFSSAPVRKPNQLMGWGIDLLTPREFEVFRRLAEGHSVRAIANLLDSCPKTVGVHQTRIMKKLGVSNAAQLAHLALSSGVIKLQPVPVPASTTVTSNRSPLAWDREGGDRDMPEAGTRAGRKRRMTLKDAGASHGSVPHAFLS
jgi:two-component system invasion response regulator UvrY